MFDDRAERENRGRAILHGLPVQRGGQSQMGTTATAGRCQARMETSPPHGSGEPDVLDLLSGQRAVGRLLPVVDAECTCTECQHLDQSTGHREVLEEVEQLVLIAERVMKDER